MMGFGYSNYRNNGIPKLRNYKEALDWWTNTKPIRGREVDTRPLGHRRRVDEYQIRKADDGTIECVLWRDVVVKFKPDGTIRLGNPFYSTTSVSNFINDIMPSKVQAYIYDHDLVIRVQDTDYFVEQRAGDWGVKDFRDVDGNVYDMPDESVGLDENYHFLEDKPDYSYKVKRKALKCVMERYKTFTEYVKNFHKVHGDTYTREEYHQPVEMLLYGMYRNWGGYQAIQAGKTFMGLLTTKGEQEYDAYNKALFMLVDTAQGSYARTSVRDKTVSLKNLMQDFDKFIRGVHRDEVFEKVYRTDNRVMRRRNRDCFTKRWDNLVDELQKMGVL